MASAPSSPDPLAAMRPNVATPDPAVVDASPWPFTRATGSAASPSSLVVEFTTDGSPCQALASADVVESASTVTVSLRVGRLPAADCSGARPQVAATMAVTVPLRAPLGSRAVVDAAGKTG